MNTSYNVRANRWKEAGMARCHSFLIALLLAIACTGAAYAQQEKTVTGQVTDENNEPLPGATIAIDGTNQGTTTDTDGMYMIDVADDAVLVFSFVGYEAQRVSVEGRARIDVQLNIAIGDLDELVVIGYGIQSRAEISSSISSIKGETVSELPVHNVNGLMKGRIPGVRVTQLSGQPGQQLQIRIRGGSSINKGNEPLFIVDGFPRNINDVNPQDIESIEVLKDASSSAIYGARASNGVVLITTKKGGRGTQDVNLHISHGFSEFGRTIETVNAATLLQKRREAIQRSPLADGLYFSGASPTGTANGQGSTWTTRFLEDGEVVPSGWQTTTDPVTGRTLVFQDNDLQETLYRRAPMTNYFLSMNGGGDNIRFYGGIGFTDEQGVAINTQWQRVSGRINIDYDFNEKLTLSTSADFSRSTTNQLQNEANIFTRGVFNAPTIRNYFEDGTPGHGINQNLANPEWVQFTRDDDQVDRYSTFGFKVDYEIFSGLNLSNRINYQLQDFSRDYFERANVFNQQRPAQFTRNQNRSFQNELLANYYKTLGVSHNISAVGGLTYWVLNADRTSAGAFGASTDNIPTLNAASNINQASSFRAEEALLSQFARISYNFDYKYLLSATIRRDGSSKFGLEKKYGYFPSVSIGWNLSNEAFFKDTNVENFINKLRLRASYGQTGNNDIDRFIAQGVYNAGLQYAGNAGIRASDMPNQNLGWEKTTQYNAGLDISFFNDRIDLIMDVYSKVTDDLLFTVQLPRETGFNSVELNVGSVKYSGYDIGLITNNIMKQNFSWTTNFNVSYNINEVVSLPDRQGVERNRINGVIFPDGMGVGGIAEGERLGSIIGLEFDYIIDNQEQANNAHYDEASTGYDPATGTSQRGRKFPGDAEWVDRNGDGIINALDQFVLGYDTPTTTGGFGNTFQYKGWEFNVLLDFAIGHTIIDQFRGWLNGNGAQGLAATTDILNAWEKPGDAAHTNQPRITFHDNSESRNHTRDTSLYSYKGDYISIREVRLAYDLPESLLRRINLQRLRLYAVGNNLHYFTKYPGLSPEVGGVVRHNSGRYPAFRTVAFGIRVGL